MTVSPTARRTRHALPGDSISARVRAADSRWRLDTGHYRLVHSSCRVRGIDNRLVRRFVEVLHKKQGCTQSRFLCRKEFNTSS